MKFINILWTFAIFLLFFGGVYYSVILKFPQFQLKKMLKGLLLSTDGGISVFKSLSMSLAARIGVGSLSGVALAIYYGGPGAIFWIWVTGIITSVNTFVESYLGYKYQERDNESFKGGPAFYILKGLKSKSLSRIYAVIVIFTYVIGFIGIQSNTIAVCINQYYKIPYIIVGFALVIIVALSISKGISQISNITSKLVPIFGIVYIFIIFFVLVKNINIIPTILINIVGSAFNIKAINGGFLSAMIIGIQRGVFITESGLGTGSIASSCTHSKDKMLLSFSQIVGIYFTVFIICTSTAILILTSNYNINDFHNINGIELTHYAFFYHMDYFGVLLLILSVITFAYSTIIAGYYYGESNIKFLFKKNHPIGYLKGLTIIVIFMGCILKPTLLWDLVDILIALLAIINMYSIIRLSRGVKQDYKRWKNLL